MKKNKVSKIEITPIQATEINEFLTKLPRVTLTTEEAVFQWAPAIINKVEHDGYTYSMIADILNKEKQIQITASTLSTYINKYKRLQNSHKNLTDSHDVTLNTEN